ncbi:hypothetical protein BAUR920_02673 [Brevibacterium aurantiacum]|uniref:Uncharacterized protein n=1 Tax=Brevibacterium aurantiacum TaxID=273384 RepID=A0A2H1K0Y1_BREAU|nr:hypothetical protein BAUR920_02673 [Brevibacterium aurantiacum]
MGSILGLQTSIQSEGAQTQGQAWSLTSNYCNGSSWSLTSRHC